MRAIANNLQHHVNTFVPGETLASLNTPKRLARELLATLREIDA
jgi:hypothetical protein